MGDFREEADRLMDAIEKHPAFPLVDWRHSKSGLRHRDEIQAALIKASEHAEARSELEQARARYLNRLAYGSSKEEAAAAEAFMRAIAREEIARTSAGGGERQGDYVAQRMTDAPTSPQPAPERGGEPLNVVIGEMFLAADCMGAGLVEANWKIANVEKHQNAIFVGIEALRSRDARIAELEKEPSNAP